MRILLLLSLLLLCSCQTTGAPEYWKLYWTLDVEQHKLDGEGTVLARIPVLDGAEVWWLSPDQIVVESTGRERGRVRGAQRTWIQPAAGTVHTLDLYSNRVAVSSYARWLEDRRRTQRASMIEVVRAARGGADKVAIYDGTLRFHDHRDGRHEFTTAGVVPGTAWRLSGHAPDERVWQHPTLLLGFHGMTPKLATRISSTLHRRAPRIVEEFSLPDQGSTLVARRLLRNSTPLSSDAELPAVPEEIADHLPEGDFDTLWKWLVDSDARPGSYDRRSIRFAIAPHVQAVHRTRIQSTVVTAEDNALQEELLLLMASFEPNWVRELLDEARINGDLALVLPCVSALSLTDTTGLQKLIRDLMVEYRLWEELDDEARLEVTTWLEGVRAWVKLRTA